MKEVKKGSKVLVYQSDNLIALNRETANHPKLMEELAKFTDLGDKIGCIGAYCNIILDGYYKQEELEKLFAILIHRLKEKRAIFVDTGGNKIIH